MAVICRVLLVTLLLYFFCLPSEVVSSAKSPKPRRSPVETCFSSRPVDHYVCPLATEILPPIVLIFTYSCKWRLKETRWFHSSGSKDPTVLAEQTADSPLLKMKDPDFANGELVEVQGCSTCLRFTGLVRPGRDEGTYFVRVVVDSKTQNELLTSHSINIHAYDTKECPSVTGNPLTISVNSQPLSSDTSVSMDATIALEFLLPSATPALKASLYVAQQNFTYVRRQLPHTCDLSTQRCSATVKVGSRAIPKVFYIDDESTNIQFILLFRYREMKPIVFRRDFQLINPDFKKRHP